VRIAYAALYTLTGAILGGAYFFLLFRSLCLHLGQAATIRIVPLHLIRFGLVLATFWVIVQEGAVPLLLAFIGFLAARFWAQFRLGAS
jgi:hypothetical protein